MSPRGNFGEILIYYPANAQFGVGSLIAKYLHNFRRQIGGISIYCPAVAETGGESLILSSLRLFCQNVASRPLRAMPFTNVTKEPAADVSLYRCPCCGSRSLRERGGFEMCPVCWWEDDGQDDHDADLVRGGPNGPFSLSQARKNYRQFRTYDTHFISSVRKPRPDEL